MQVLQLELQHRPPGGGGGKYRATLSLFPHPSTFYDVNPKMRIFSGLGCLFSHWYPQDHSLHSPGAFTLTQKISLEGTTG